MLYYYHYTEHTKQLHVQQIKRRYMYVCIFCMVMIEYVERFNENYMINENLIIIHVIRNMSHWQIDILSC